jgi:hypothetical protein
VDEREIERQLESNAGKSLSRVAFSGGVVRHPRIKIDSELLGIVF